MSVQRNILARLVVQLSNRYPGCGVLVGGSVQRGEERPDSDLDLFVVFPGDGAVHLEHDRSSEGIKVDIALFPEQAFLCEVQSQWYNFWMFSRAEIIHDPTGIAKRNQDSALSYFRQYPEVDRAWERQIAEVRRHKADKSYRLELPTWDDFSKHVRAMVEGAS